MAFNWNKFPWTNLHDLNLDWIIQKVKELEIKVLDAAQVAVQYVDSKITDLLTGDGDLTVTKTGDIRITANSVQVTGGSTFIDHGDQVTLYDPNSKTGMSATYASSKLDLWNNQDLNNGVAVYHVRTPAEGEYPEGTYPYNNFAASVGYVKTAVNAVSEAPEFHVAGTTAANGVLTSVTFKEGYSKSEFDNLLSQSARVRLVVEIPDENPQYNETRFLDTCGAAAGTYVFSSVSVKGASAAYPQNIVYNGTAFTIVNPDFLTLETLPIYGGETV